MSPPTALDGTLGHRRSVVGSCWSDCVRGNHDQRHGRVPRTWRAALIRRSVDTTRARLVPRDVHNNQRQTPPGPTHQHHRPVAGAHASASEQRTSDETPPHQPHNANPHLTNLTNQRNQPPTKPAPKRGTSAGLRVGGGLGGFRGSAPCFSRVAARKRSNSPRIVTRFGSDWV